MQNFSFFQGTADTIVNIKGTTFNYDFLIAPQTFPTDTNGILRKDFLEKKLCEIDYVTFPVNTYTNEQDITISIESNIVDYRKQNNKTVCDELPLTKLEYAL